MIKKEKLKTTPLAELYKKKEMEVEAEKEKEKEKEGNNKCPSHYQINIPDKNITIDVNDILRAIYKSININDLKQVSHIKWAYYSNAVEYLLRAFRKGNIENDLKKSLHEIELFLKEEE